MGSRSDGAFRRLQPPPLTHAACSLLKTLERVIPRQHGLPKSPCACPMSTRVWGLREYLGFDFGRPHYTPPEQVFVIVGFPGLLCRVGRCGIFVTPASGLLGMWSLWGGRAMERLIRRCACVLEIGEKHLQILEVMAFVIFNIYKFYWYLSLMTSFFLSR